MATKLRKRTPVEPPSEEGDMGLVIQYLDWALIAAYSKANPDLREVRIRLDLERRQSTTAYLTKGSKTISPLTPGDAKVLRDLCERRVADLEAKAEACVGDLYPSIMASEQKRIADLFEKLTGYRLTDPEPSN